MPFGLHSAAATFQRLMDKVLASLQNCAAAYIDDIIVYSDTWEEYLSHLRRVLRELRKAGLTVNQKKYKIALPKVEYLDFKVGKGGIQPQQEKVTKISQWYRPQMEREVQQFFGLVGYYRQFISQFSTIAAPLTDLTP